MIAATGKDRLPIRVNGWAMVRVFALALCAGLLIAYTANGNANSTETLRAQYGALQHRLNNNSFKSPLTLDSRESAGGVTGEIYALVDYPFAKVGAALNSAGNWCDIMILHLNTKYCRAVNEGRMLNVSIGKKFDQPLDDAYRVNFSWRVAEQTAHYLQVNLHANEGPLSTRDYRIALEAVALESGQTFIHLSYAYAYGVVGRIAMQTYLGTIAANKVGFTAAGKHSNGQPVYIGGMRGLVERNTMRYYLAIEAFLGALSAPPQGRMEKSLSDWFTAIERYPRQLHELERNEYLDMKRKEILRQQARAPATAPCCYSDAQRKSTVLSLAPATVTLRRSVTPATVAATW